VVPEREVRIPSPVSDRTDLTGCGPSETGDSRTDRQAGGVVVLQIGEAWVPSSLTHLVGGGDALLED
jgi:hypothetical protein